MAFNFTVTLLDPSAEPSAVDDGLVTDLGDALGQWGKYIDGAAGGTVNVSLNITSLPSIGASAGPTEVENIGTTSTGATIVEPAAVFVLDNGAQPAGATTDISVQVDPRALSAWFINPTPGADGSLSVPSGQYDATSIMVHEIGHGLGFTGYYDTMNNSGTLTDGGLYETPYDTNIATHPDGSADFVGPQAEAVEGGPVPITTIGPPGSNYYHLEDAQTDVMTGSVLTTGLAYHISPLDVAVLADSGVPLTAAGLAFITPQSPTVGGGGSTVTGGGSVTGGGNGVGSTVGAGGGGSTVTGGSVTGGGNGVGSTVGAGGGGSTVTGGGSVTGGGNGVGSTVGAGGGGSTVTGGSVTGGGGSTVAAGGSPTVSVGGGASSVAGSGSVGATVPAPTVGGGDGGTVGAPNPGGATGPVTVQGPGGTVIVFGRAGGGDVVNEGPSTEFVSGPGGVSTVNASPGGTDTIFAVGSVVDNGAAGANSLFIGNGAPVAVAGAANEVVFAGPGGGVYTAGSDSFFFGGGGGADTIVGNAANSVYWTNAGERMTLLAKSPDDPGAHIVAFGDQASVDMTNAAGRDSVVLWNAEIGSDGNATGFTGDTTLTASNAGNDLFAMFAGSQFGTPPDAPHTITVANWQASDVFDLSFAQDGAGHFLAGYTAADAASAQSQLAAGNSFTLSDGTTVAFQGLKPTTVAHV